MREFLRRHVFGSLAVVAVVLATALLVGWQARSRRPRYVTASVTRGNIQRSVGATGSLNPVVTVQVGSYVSGTIKSLSCDYNTEVVVGQTCARIDPVPFQLIVEEDRAQVGTAKAQLDKDRASLLYAKTAYERDAKLVAEGTVSQDTVDNEKSAYDQAVAQIGLDKAAIVDKESALKAAEVNLAYTNIVSPVVGTVITRSIDVGQTVAASLQSPTLFLIGRDLTQMQVDTNVSEADVGEIRPGQDASFTVQAFPGRTFHGKVTVIRHGPITVQNVVTYDVVVAVPNPDRRLFPGMTADTHVVIDEHENVLRVPLPAVRFTPEGLSAAAPRRTATAVAEGAPGGVGPTLSEASSESASSGTSTETAGGRRWARGGGGRTGAEGGGEERTEGHGGGRGKAQGGERRRDGGGGRRAERHSQVWVLENDRLRAVPVTTGIDDGTLIEVAGDLKPGERVVVNEIVPGAEKRTGPGGNPAFRQPGAPLGPQAGPPGPRP